MGRRMTKLQAQLDASLAILTTYGNQRGGEIIRELKRAEEDCQLCDTLHPAMIHCVACGAPACADALDVRERDHCVACADWARQHDSDYLACPVCEATHGGCGCGR